MKTYFLCCDIGGTNTSIGLIVKNKDNHFILLEVQRFESRHINNISTHLQSTIETLCSAHGLDTRPPLCISAAGPTDGETCTLSNLQHFTINRKQIEQLLDVPVMLINDFSAIAYSLMVLDIKNSQQLMQITPMLLQQSKQSNKNSTTHVATKNNSSDVCLAVGAGTGLGMAILYKKENTANLIPSEGGWRHFSPSDKLSMMYYHHLSKYENTPCYWEDAICGSRGIPSICRFFANSDSQTHWLLPDKGENQFLQTLIDTTQTKMLSPTISKLANDGNSACIKIMRFWTLLYAKCCSETATICLPFGGIYIAGGIATKNLSFFTKDNLFYVHFTQHRNPIMKKMLEQIPVYIIMDYHSSLYGDAYIIDTTLSQTGTERNVKTAH